MKALVTKTVLATSVALATLIAAETAYARENPTAPNASYAQRHGARDIESSGKVDRRITPQSNDVRAGNRGIGRDPDPFIRGEILRHYHSGWPD
jgi:hypothetical protein